MSSLQDRMRNYNVAPPANAWEKIAMSLDESEIANKFPSKLYDIQVNPPVDTWDKISGALDEQLSQNELPPRLYNLEIDPPVGAWAKIAASLNTLNEPAAPVRKLSPLFRYAAAALVIGAVAWGITRITVNNPSDGNNTAALEVKKDTNVSAKNMPADTMPATVTIASGEDALLEKSKKMTAALDRKKVIRKVAATMPSGNDDNEVVIDPGLSQSIYAYAAQIPDIAGRYVMLMTPDGNIIRMSKKWSDLLCCVSGEDQDTGCKNQLKKWQEKMAASSLAPSPANFMDILSMVSSLNESNGL